MTALLFALLAQILLGGLDNLLHHELTEKLPSRVSARKELALHGARELIYAILFLVFAFIAPHGLWAWALLALVLCEIIITLADFIEEDKTRTLPPFERVLHTLLAIQFGAIIALAAPIWLTWAQSPTALVVEQRGWFALVFVLAALGVGAWGLRNAFAAFQLYAKHNAEQRTPEPRADRRQPVRTLLVTGATGFIGEAFVRARLAAGDEIIVLSRDPRRAEALFDARVLAVSDLARIPASTRIHATINLAGAGIANALWTESRKRALIQTRLNATNSIAALIERLEHKPELMISASAVGYYGDRGEEILSESAAPGAGFTSALCQAWENAHIRAAAHAERELRLRFGLVLGRDGGAWPSLVAALPFGLAAQFGDGRQFMAWIHKQDAVRLLEAALDNPKLSGPINAVAPKPARHGEVIAAIARGAGGVLTLAAPAPLLKLGLGDMACLFLDSQNVSAPAAEAAGFQFRFQDIHAAASDLLRAPNAARADQRAALS